MIGRTVSERIQRIWYVVTDWVTANLAFVLFNAARYVLVNHHDLDFDGLVHYLDTPKLIAEQIIIPIVMLGVYALSGYYNRPLERSRLQELVTTFSSSFFNTFLIYLALLTNDQIVHRTTNWLMILILLGCLFGCTYFGRIILTQVSRRRLIRHEWGINTLVIGNSEAARRVATNLTTSRSTLGYKVVGFVEIEGENSLPGDGTPVIGFEEIPAAVRKWEVDQFVIATETRDEDSILDIVYRLFPFNLSIKIQPDTLSIITSSIRLQDIYGEPLVDLASPAMSEGAKNIKRLSDIVISAGALFMLMPVYAILALWVRKDSKGPVFYRQERIGRHRRPFNIIKFRTMRTDAEKDGPRLSSENDPRITRSGRFMRKYRLDELPQFWNVLKGDMSLVGPRPERSFFINRIIPKAPFYGLVHQVRPGITSWGMVKYGYASTVDEMVRRARYDLIYLANMSVSVDLKILIHTVKTVITGKGK
ncbi:MAG: sugar transferase [Muribaculaceae bacterium]|nr:sugar transferase [Muribaculaceae bacterium]